MPNLRSIEVLNTLIKINNDRIKGYERATREIREEELKAIFHDFISNSRKCKGELHWEVRNLGGQPTQNTLLSGRLYRIWMSMAAKLSGNSRKAILQYCRYGEEQTLNTYTRVLNQQAQYLSQTQQSIVKEQFNELRADHERVQQMRQGVPA